MSNDLFRDPLDQVTAKYLAPRVIPWWRSPRVVAQKLNVSWCFQQWDVQCLSMVTCWCVDIHHGLCGRHPLSSLLDLDAQRFETCTWKSFEYFFPCDFPPTRLAMSFHPCHWQCLILRRASLHLGAKNHPFLEGLARGLDESGKHRLWYSLSKWMLPCIVCHQPLSWVYLKIMNCQDGWLGNNRKHGPKAVAFPSGLFKGWRLTAGHRPKGCYVGPMFASLGPIPALC